MSAAAQAPVARCAIDTSRHYLSHLTAPSGRGGWMFEDKAGQVVVTCSGTYSEAAQAARKFGKAHGHAVLYVCP